MGASRLKLFLSDCANALNLLSDDCGGLVGRVPEHIPGGYWAAVQMDFHPVEKGVLYGIGFRGSARFRPGEIVSTFGGPLLRLEFEMAAFPSKPWIA